MLTAILSARSVSESLLDDAGVIAAEDAGVVAANSHLVRSTVDSISLSSAKITPRSEGVDGTATRGDTAW